MDAARRAWTPVLAALEGAARTFKHVRLTLNAGDKTTMLLMLTSSNSFVFFVAGFIPKHETSTPESQLLVQAAGAGSSRTHD